MKVLKDKKLSREEFIDDIKKEKWRQYCYSLDIENPNQNAGFVLARGHVLFA